MNTATNKMPPANMLYSRVGAVPGGDVADAHNLAPNDHGTVVDIDYDKVVILMDRYFPNLEKYDNKIYMSYGEDGGYFSDSFKRVRDNLRLMDYGAWEQQGNRQFYSSDWLFPVSDDRLPIRFDIAFNVNADSAPYNIYNTALVFNKSKLEWTAIFVINEMLLKIESPDYHEEITRHHVIKAEEQMLRRACYLLL